MTHTLRALEAAAALVHGAMAPTTEQRWPLLDARCGTAVWVKHENQTPVGAFKVRGGLVYLDDLRRNRPAAKGVVAATRGNHGQSIGFAARRHGIPAAVVVPQGNSIGKNRAMRALGVELIEQGHDFQASLEAAAGSPPNADGTRSRHSIRCWSAASPPTPWNCFVPCRTSTSCMYLSASARVSAARWRRATRSG